MPLLQEIPGATERPSGCRIRVWQSEDGRETLISIPRRAAPFWLLLAAAVLCVNLLLVFGTGLALFFAHKSVLFMMEIAPGDLPLTMRRYEPWYAFGWGALLTVGIWVVAAMLRPLFLRERLTISPDGFAREFTVGRRHAIARIALSELRGFHLQRDPQGLTPGVLTVLGRGETLTVGEYLPEADREWLASIGNALLRML